MSRPIMEGYLAVMQKTAAPGRTTPRGWVSGGKLRGRTNAIRRILLAPFWALIPAASRPLVNCRQACVVKEEKEWGDGGNDGSGEINSNHNLN